MKNKLVCLLILGCTSVCSTSAQTTESGTLNIGWDPLLQGLYVGFDHQMNDYSIGLDLGTSLGIIYPKNYFSVSMDNNLYFGELNKSGHQSWHLNARMNLISIIDASLPYKICLSPGIGKNFMISDNLALNLDLGLQVPVYSSSIEAFFGNDTYYKFPTSNIIPCLRLELKFK